MENTVYEVESQEDKKIPRGALYHLLVKNCSVCRPSEHETMPNASDFEQNDHGKWIGCDVLIAGETKFWAALVDQQLENRQGWLRISMLELLAATAVPRSPGLCSFHLNDFHNARLSIY